MALKGDLGDLDVADLIQLNCQSGTRARLIVQSNDDTIEVYFDGGQVVHAQSLGAQDASGEGALEGEEAVYEVLTWEKGIFEVEQGMTPPITTVTMPWSALLMEGMRRLDERRYDDTSETSGGKESEEMAEETRSEKLTNMLRNLVDMSADVKGVAVVSMDGLIMRAELPAQMEQARVGAIAAAILSLSGRSVQQLQRGAFKQTLVQGEDGNIIITSAGKNVLFVALTSSDANMGMVFLEVREGADAVAGILG